MRHQKLHLIGQNPPVAQDEVFPKAGHVGRIKQGHARLLGGAGGFAVIAAFAGRDDIHPVILPIECIRDDVFAGEVFLVEMTATVSADVAVSHEEFAVGQAGAQVKGVDLGHALGADDGADMNDALLAGDGVVPAAKRGHAFAHLPAHLFGGIVNDRLLQADPTLWQPLGR